VQAAKQCGERRQGHEGDEGVVLQTHFSNAIEKGEGAC